jgi:hypothetical protein
VEVSTCVIQSGPVIGLQSSMMLTVPGGNDIHSFETGNKRKSNLNFFPDKILQRSWLDISRSMMLAREQYLCQAGNGNSLFDSSPAFSSTIKVAVARKDLDQLLVFGWTLASASGSDHFSLLSQRS